LAFAQLPERRKKWKQKQKSLLHLGKVRKKRKDRFSLKEFAIIIVIVVKILLGNKDSSCFFTSASFEELPNKRHRVVSLWADLRKDWHWITITCIV
jgi:hypothetical protein